MSTSCQAQHLLLQVHNYIALSGRARDAENISPLVLQSYLEGSTLFPAPLCCWNDCGRVSSATLFPTWNMPDDLLQLELQILCGGGKHDANGTTRRMGELLRSAPSRDPIQIAGRWVVQSF